MTAPVSHSEPPPADPPPAAPRRRGQRLQLALLLFVSIVLASGIGLAVTRSDASNSVDPDALAAALGAQAKGLVTTAPAGTAGGGVHVRPSVTGSTLPPLPLPDAPPADPYAPTPQVVLGSISIPALGVTADMQEGITLTAVNRGPGHWPGTPMPGELGNMVVAGHRTTYSKPFADLDLLHPGDKVIFTMPNGTFVYQVRGLIIVPSANIGIATQSRAHTATLFACHPKHSAAYRIVAKLELLGPDGKPVDPESALPPIDQGSDPVTDTTLVVADNGQGGAPGGGAPLAGGDG